MMERTRRRAWPVGPILLLLMGAVVLYLMVDFGRWVSLSYQRRKELHQMEAQLATAQARQAELEERLAYARSEAAVQEWARDNGLTLAGEVPVVVVAPEANNPAQAGGQTPAPDASPTAIREAWWNLFFGPHSGW